MSRKLFAYDGEIPSQTGDDLIELMACWVKRAAEPAEIGEHTKAQINRSAARLEMTPNQIKKLWYRERRSIRADEYLKIKTVIDRLEWRSENRREMLADLHRSRTELAQRKPLPDLRPLGGMARKTPE